jgi:hypothetical protein
MTLPGYEELLPDDLDLSGLLVDGWPLADRPGFWAGFWREQFIEDDGVLPRVWGVTDEVVRARMTELYDHAAWPVFRVALRDGAELAVVCRNFADDAGVDFLVLPHGGAHIRIAGVEGHYSGPGLSWPELLAVAGRQPDPVRRAQTVLLLAPATGDEAAGAPEAATVFADALRTLGAGGLPADLAALSAHAARSVSGDESLFWDPVAWTGGVPAGEYAPRDPAAPVALPAADRHLVNALLAP